jgi:tetratricopeptide (TPR) repeat protein
VSSLLIGLLSALVATNTPAAVSNLVSQTTGLSISIPDPNDPVEKEYKKLMEDDDAAEAEVDGWIQENQAFAAKGAAIPPAELARRIRNRLDIVKKAYEDFIKRHPDHARVRIAFAGLLEDLGDEDGEVEQLEKARELDPKIPSAWNQLGNFYGHNGPVTNAFAYYAKAIELDPTESVYYHNLALTVYLFRKDAKEFYHVTEQQVFDKALELYNQSFKLDPTNFPLAVDLAESYYGIRPVRTDDALRAFTNALNIAHDEIEREGVYIHLARFKMNAGRFNEARAHLNAVTNEMYAALKDRLARNVESKEKEATETIRPAGTSTNDASLLELPVATPRPANAPPAGKK